MTPLKLTVKNMCQHRYREIDFTCGITGIIGNNGCGKSNFADTCTFFAISGKTPSGVNKSELLSWGTTAGYTEFVFSHNDTEFVLKRNIHNATVSLSGGDIDVSGKEANKLMEEILGMSFDIFYETCWTSQGGLTSILTDTHSVRLSLFQKLANVDRLEKIRGMLQEKYNKLPNLPDRSDQIAESQSQIVRLSTQQESTQATVDQYQVLLVEGDAQIDKARKAHNALSVTAKQQQVFQKKSVCAEIEVATIAFREEHQIVELVPVDPPSSDILEKQKNYENHIRMSSDTEILSAALLEKEPVLAKLVEERATAVEALRVTLSEVETAEALLAKVAPRYNMLTEDVCPTCNRALSEDTEELTSESKAEIIQLYTKIQESVAEKKALHAVATHTSGTTGERLTIAQVEYKNLQGRLEELAAAILALPSFVDYDPAQYATQKQLYEKYTTSLQAQKHLADQLKELELRASKAQVELDHTEALPAETEEAINNAGNFIIQYNDLVDTLNASKSQLAVLTKELEMQTEVLNRYTAEQQQLEATSVIYRTLERCRDVLHKDQLPKLVMRKMLGGLNNLLEGYLGLFDTNFTAFIDEDFDFRCNFVNQDNVPAKLLSGGQKVALAIAFRFALSDLLSTSIPMLTLDEPTVFLDEANIKKVAEVLEKAKQTAERGIILTVATHEPELQAAFSRTINISEEYKEG